MNIYKIPHDEFEYDYYMGHVIVANNRQEVLDLAKDTPDGNEPWAVWDKATIETIGQYFGDKIQPFILLSDFKAG